MDNAKKKKKKKKSKKKNKNRLLTGYRNHEN